MCGIFGYIGTSATAPQIVLDGLKLLEYRGYDSWGVASKVKRSFIVEKHVGKIGNANLNSESLHDKSNVAIGHTRWATHGGVTEVNAHPHLDCKGHIAVVHNGIVENYLQLKEKLLKRGHVFISETDTEIIPHLIEESMRSKGHVDGTKEFAVAVREAFNQLEGMNAIVVGYSVSNEIVAAKTGSPLVVGIGENEFFIASDPAGIVKHTKRVLFIQDNQMVILEKGIKLLNLLDGEEVQPEIQKIDWDIEEADIGTYPHFMLKEIYEQSKVIRNMLYGSDKILDDFAHVVKNAYGTFFIAAGTAYHAAIGGVYWFSHIAHTHVNAAFASEFNYLEDFLTDKSLVVALSQSGETIDVVEPLTRAKKRGSKIASITNVLGSTIYRISDYKILLGAGPEKAVASTKAYVAKLSLLLVLAYSMIGETEKAKHILSLVAKEIERLLEKQTVATIEQIADTLSDSHNIYVIGRGSSWGSALEAALKIKEVSYIHTEGLAGGELKHGTLALITKGVPCIVFAPNDDTYQAMLSNAMEIKSRGGFIIGISPRNSEIFDIWIEVKDIEEGSIIAQIIPVQLLSYFLAVKKGNDPDKPRNLAKSVTVK